MRTAEDSFTVIAPIARLAVTVAHGAVTRIVLHGHGRREPRGRLERQIEQELSEYFAGVRQAFTFPVRTEGTEFQQRVWHQLQQIPYGATLTYGELAKIIGKPRAYRAVGTANGKNPVPIVVPCHRVVAAGGKLGGYGGGLSLKRKLLELEDRNSAIPEGPSTLGSRGTPIASP